MDQARKQVEIIFGGQGGQGVRLAATLLGRACAAAGRQVASSASYGPEVRGTFTRSEVIVSDAMIVYPRVLRPDVLAALSQEAYDRLRIEVPAGGVILYEAEAVAPAQEAAARQYPVPALRVAARLGNPRAANMVMLGAVAGATGLIDLPALRESLPARDRDVNAAALEEGFERGLGLAAPAGRP